MTISGFGDGRLRALLRDLAAQHGATGTMELAELGHQYLHNQATAGDTWAGAILTAMELSGLRSVSQRVFKEEHIVAEIPNRKITIPRYIGVRLRDQNGKLQPSRVQLDFREMGLVEYRSYVQEIRQARDELTIQLEVHERCLACYERHPDASNLADACVLDGIDPDQLVFAS